MWWIKLERWWLFQMAMKRWWLRKESHGKEVYQKFPLNQGKDHLLRRSNMDNGAYIFKAICRSRDCRTILHHDGGGAPLIYHIESTPFGWLMEHGRGTGGCRVLPTGAPWWRRSKVSSPSCSSLRTDRRGDSRLSRVADRPNLAKFGTRAGCLSMAANTIVEIEGFRTLYFGPELFYLLNAKAFESNLFTTVTQYA